MSNTTHIILAFSFLIVFIVLGLGSVLSTKDKYRKRDYDKADFLNSLAGSVLMVSTSIWLISLIIYLMSI